MAKSWRSMTAKAFSCLASVTQMVGCYGKLLGKSALTSVNGEMQMRSTLSPQEAGSDAVFPAPRDRKAQRDRKVAEEPISRLAQEIAKSRALQRGVEPSLDEAEPSNDPLPISGPSFGRRATRVLARFLIAAFIGVAATLAWQSSGEDAKHIIANWAQQQLGWSISLSTTNPPPRPEIDPVPPSSPAVQASAQITPETPPASADVQQLEAIARGLASVQQSVERLATGQEEMARNIARLEAAEQDVRQRVLAPSAKSTAAPARNPAQTPPPAKPAPRVSAASPPSPALPSPSRP
jgi:hypothetical protein